MLSREDRAGYRAMIAKGAAPWPAVVVGLLLDALDELDPPPDKAEGFPIRPAWVMCTCGNRHLVAEREVAHGDRLVVTCRNCWTQTTHSLRLDPDWPGLVLGSPIEDPPPEPAEDEPCANCAQLRATLRLVREEREFWRGKSHGACEEARLAAERRDAMYRAVAIVGL